MAESRSEVSTAEVPVASATRPTRARALDALYRAMGIPTNMFTVMFALGRVPGWIAHWREMELDPSQKIYRPRQIYIGPQERPYVNPEI